MLKITHIGKYFHPEKGGIESVTMTLARGAAIYGYKVTVICFDKINNVVQKEYMQGIEIIKCPLFTIIKSQPLGFRYALKSIVSSLRADIVHLHAPNILAAFCSIFIPKNTKLIVHWHSDVMNKGLIGKLVYPIEMRCYYGQIS